MPFTGGGGGGRGVAVSDVFALATDYTAGQRMLDESINVTFLCLANVTAATLKPSEDPDNWLGYDDYKLGRLSLMAHGASNGPMLALGSTVTTIDRTKYVRLFRKICPQYACKITSGSTVLSLPPGASVVPGMFIEGVGVAAGSTVAVIAASSTKIGTLTSGISKIFFRSGVVVPNVTNPSEVTGNGLAAATTATASTADMSGTLTATGASNNVFAAPAVTTFNNATAGCYITGTGIPASTRLAAVFPRVITTANAKNLTGSPLVYCPCDLYSQAAAISLLVGRQLSMTGLAANISAVTDQEETLPGTWSWITATGWYGPYNATVGTNAKPYVNRHISGGPIADAASSVVVTVNAATSRTVSFDSGLTTLFWLNAGNAAAPTNFTNRYVGSATAGIPADAYVTTQTAQTTALQIASTVGSLSLCTNVGSGLTPTVGRYVTVTGSGVTDRRITASSAEFADANTRTVNTSNLVYVSPTDVGALAGTLYRVGQRFTVAGIAANSNITDIGSVYQLATASISTASNNTRLFVPVGELTTNAAQWFVNRRVNGAGIPTSATISSITADVTTTLDTTASSTTASLPTGSGVTTLWSNAYITAGSAVAAPTRITTATVESTVASSRSVLGLSQAFMPTGTVVTGFYVGQRISVPTAFTNATITATPVVQFTSANCSTVIATANLFVQPGLSAANITAGQGISGTNIPAATTIAVEGSDFADASVRTFTGTANLGLPVGTVNVAEYAANRKITGTGIAANANIVSIGAEVVTGAFQMPNLGSVTLDLTPGTGLAATWVGRFIASTGSALPSSATVASVVTIDFTAAAVQATAGVAKVFFAAGQAMGSILSNKSFTLPLAWPIIPVRISGAPVTQFTSTNSSTVIGTANLFVQPGIPAASVSAGQTVTGTNIPAATTLATLGSDGAVPTHSTVVGLTGLATTVGADLSGMVVNRKVVATGVGANANIIAAGTETSFTNLGTLSGTSFVYLTVGSSAVGVSQPRYISLAGLPTDTRLLGAISAETTQVTTTTVTGVANIYWPGGGTLGASVIAGAYVTAGGIASPARISSTVALASTTATSRTTTAATTVPLSPNFTNAQVLVGRGISGTGIPANARISAITAPQVTIVNCTYGLGASTITCPSSTGATVGAVILGAGIAAGTTITGTTGTTISLSAPTTAAGAGVSVGSGALVVISAAATATSTGVFLTLTTYIVATANSTAGATATATIGASNGTSAAASATTAAGVTATLGALHSLSVANASTQSDITTGTLGAVHVMSANATASAINTTVTFAPWANTASVALATQAGGTATFGGRITVSNAATSSLTTDVFTFGRQVVISSNATATATITNAVLGAVHMMSANATASAAATTVTFFPWMAISAAAAVTVTGTATFGGSLLLGTAATATAIAQTCTVGGAAVLSIATGITIDNGPVDLGRRLTVSAAATATATGSSTFATWVDTAAVATATTAGANGSFGAMTTISAASSASSGTSVVTDFGANFVPLTTTAATTRGVANVKTGAVLTATANATTSNAAAAITMGTACTMDAAATASGSPVVVIAGFVNTDTPAASNQVDQTYSFGSVVSLSAVATATNETASLRFFPYGYGDSNGVTGTTFGLPFDVSGRVLMVAGTGTGLTSRPINSSVGTETHLLTGSESGTSNHAHGNSIAASYFGQNLVAAAGTGATGAGFISNAGAGGSTYNMTMAGTVTNSVAASAASPHNIMQPSKAVGLALAVYAGTV